VTADWGTVREIASALPGTEEHTSYGHPAFRVGGKLFVWMSPNREAAGALALRVDPDEKPLLIASNPGVYFEVPHYHGHPIILVHLEAIARDELSERIEDAWALRAPKRLLAERTETA
jgi:hypothetical protein